MHIMIGSFMGIFEGGYVAKDRMIVPEVSGVGLLGKLVVFRTENAVPPNVQKSASQATDASK